MVNSPRLYININGNVCPASEARISPLDHGFLYGDSVYETVRTFFGRPFLLGHDLPKSFSARQDCSMIVVQLDAV